MKSSKILLPFFLAEAAHMFTRGQGRLDNSFMLKRLARLPYQFETDYFVTR
jgi:hypothetical protein